MLKAWVVQFYMPIISLDMQFKVDLKAMQHKILLSYCDVSVYF